MGLFSKKPGRVLVVQAPHAGNVKGLASLKDGVFSEQMLGPGIVIEADRKAQTIDVLAPISGKLRTVFRTGHAFGIKSKGGLEILVHIGLETVKLNGQGFLIHVAQDQTIKMGTKLATVDLEFVRKNAPLAHTIVIVVSNQKMVDVNLGLVQAQKPLFKVTMK